MNNDMTVVVGGSVLNLRVGAIITRGDQVLMVRNEREDYYYSVGGRIQVGETSEQAVLREVTEELGSRWRSTASASSMRIISTGRSEIRSSGKFMRSAFSIT